LEVEVTLGESIILLVITAGLTGLLIPLVKELIDRGRLAKQNRFEDERLKAQKRFEADLARQTKIIDAQADLVDNLAGTLWAFEKLILRVTYYGAAGDFEKFRSAFTKFDDEAWDLLAQVLAANSKARRLASPEAQNRLVKLYAYLVTDVAPQLEPLRGSRPTEGGRLSAELRDACHRLNRAVYEEVAAEIDDVLTNFANEFRLSVPPR
jgi:hypothetical protein